MGPDGPTLSVRVLMIMTFFGVRLVLVVRLTLNILPFNPEPLSTDACDLLCGGVRLVLVVRMTLNILPFNPEPLSTS